MIIALSAVAAAVVSGLALGLAGILAAAFVLCLASLAYDSFNPFLYFRF